MTIDAAHLRRLVAEFTGDHSLEELHARLQPHHERPARLPTAPDDRAGRWRALAADPAVQAVLDQADDAVDAANIENRIGRIALPLGVAGPLRVNGLHAQDDYWLPLATSEAALVASVHRGCAALARAGGVRALVLAEGVARSPVFLFDDLAAVGRFVIWLVEEEEALKRVAAGTTQHGSLDQIRVNAEGNHVYLLCIYRTGDAAGQNMVTIATQAVCEYIVAHAPVSPRHWFVEGNASGDKKATAQSFSFVRGRKVAAEAVLPGSVIARYLHTTAAEMERYWRCSAVGGVLTGSIGVQGHYANALAALFLATGQDAACVSEAAVGVTRFEVVADDALYVAVTLPNVIVGTVGGGTGLPSQRACLELMGLAGSGHAAALAEVCTAAALAGEISIIGSLAAGDFAAAHERLARHRRDEQAHG